MCLAMFHVSFKQNGAFGRTFLAFFWSLADHDEFNFQRRPQHSPIMNHNMLGIPSAQDLRPISANASLWHTLWWWLDQAGSTYNKLWTPS